MAAAFFSPEGFIPAWAAGLMLACVAVEAFRLRRPSPSQAPWRSLVFLALWAAFALLPVINVLPFPKFLSYFRAAAPRYLAFAGAGLALAPCAERRYAEALEAYRRTASSIAFTWPEHWAALREAMFLSAGARQAHNGAMDAFRSGDPDAAIRGFTKAITLDPGFGPAYASRAALLARKGDKAAAARDCETALRQPISAKLRALVNSTKESLGR